VLGLTFTATDHACSFERGLSAVKQAHVSQSHAVSEYSLFFVHAQLFFSRSPQSSCSCVQELFCSITGLYPELLVSSTTYIQVLALSDLSYINKKAVYLAFCCGFLLCSGEFSIFLRKVGKDFCFLRLKLYVLLKCDYTQAR